MTSPTEQRRAFDAAMQAYRAGDMARARTAFTAVTAREPEHVRCLAGPDGVRRPRPARRWRAPTRTRARCTARPAASGCNDGDLYAQIAAPLYVTVPVWSRATIGLAYAAALIAARRYDDAVSVLDDPIITADTQAAQWHQFITACLFHQTRRWPDVRSATAVCSARQRHLCLDAVSAAAVSMSAAAAASLGQFQAGARAAPTRSRPTTPTSPPISP